MTEKMIQKHITLTQTTKDILDELISNTVGINNYSEAIRYAILSIADKTNDGQNLQNLTKKMNVMSKNIDMLIEMSAGGFHELGVKAIGGDSEEAFIYMDAKRNVENKIQKATTIKSNPKTVKQNPNPINKVQQNKEVEQTITNKTNTPRFTL
ncbi:hypothetical protein ACDI16_14105 [Oceanobacillus caeni]|nr:hypothetical protein [Virgibacillus sp. SK37]HAJ4038287.1 hypothetical protein [Escherichia coli]